jgi:hypothetical protein
MHEEYIDNHLRQKRYESVVHIDALAKSHRRRVVRG